MTDHAVSHRRHPTIREYWLIGFILAVITAAEIAITYIDGLSSAIVVPSLLIMMVAKFAIVALFFMHLRFDKPTYLRFFIVGIAGAITLFSVVLLSFGLLVGS